MCYLFFAGMFLYLLYFPFCVDGNICICLLYTSKKEAAETFLEFCYRKENYRKVLQAMYAIPVTKSAVLYACLLYTSL